MYTAVEGAETASQICQPRQSFVSPSKDWHLSPAQDQAYELHRREMWLRPGHVNQNDPTRSIAAHLWARYTRQPVPCEPRVASTFYQVSRILNSKKNDLVPATSRHLRREISFQCYDWLLGEAQLLVLANRQYGPNSSVFWDVAGHSPVKKQAPCQWVSWWAATQSCAAWWCCAP